MKIIIKGRHVEITDALRNYLEKKLTKVEKHFDHILEATVVLSVEKNRQIVEVTLQARKALIRAEVETDDMYASIDKATDRLERQIRKYKEKYLKKPHNNLDRKELIKEEVNASAEDTKLDKTVKIVKTKRFAIKPMSVEEAAMQMNLLGHTFFVFANDITNTVNVLYKRKDGNFGLIEPEF
ncbi:MAG: ribosome-associated translation inhibitor RaiA [Candidatus Caldatribacteriota bacterium]|nr:ribosome-associated translation inhibitor RaiA [Candidatus Caldatribacteriota bacterium]